MRRMIGILSVIWLLGAFVGYIYIHKAFSPENVLGILQTVWQIVVVVAIVSLAGGLGTLTRLHTLDVPPITRAALTSALGLGIISVVVLVVGATIGLNIFLGILLLIGVAIFHKRILVWWKYWLEAGSIYREAGKFGRVIFIFVALIFLCQLVVALAPPLWFDTLNYHLAIPQELIQHGRIEYISNNMEWGNARQIETLYLLGMWIGGAETAPLLGWAVGLLTLLALAAFLGKIFDQDSAWVAVASLMCGSSLAGLLASGYVDWATMLFALAMLVCLIQWALNQETGLLPLAGLFAGMAFATKYTGGFVPVLGVILILCFQDAFSPRRALTNLVMFGSTALLIAIPWLAKNMLATGNPFYPLFIPGGAMDATRLAFYQREPIRDWSRLLLLPWQITVWGAEGTNGFGSSIGPLLLGLSPLALAGWKDDDQLRRRVVAIGAVVTLAMFLIWAVGSQFSNNLMETRYYFPGFIAWALLCAAGYFAISRMKIPGLRVTNLLAALVLLALGFNAFETVKSVSTSNPLSAVLRREAPEDYIKRNLGGYELAMQTIRALPENARVLMLWEPRGFECLPKCDSDEVIDRWHYDWDVYGNPNKIIETWREQGYTHVIINRAGVDFLRANDPHAPGLRAGFWDGLGQTLASLSLTQSVGGYELYSFP